jgi:RNA polymerase sigma-70 factor (ECF subfamily)
MTAEVDQELLSTLHSLGREAWPEIDLALGTFSSLVARQLREGRRDDIRADDLYLAAACAAGIEPAITAFDRYCLSGIAPALVRRGYDPAIAADAVQTLRVRFLVGEGGRAPRITEYNGRGALTTWLQVTAVRIAISARRKYHRETGGEVEIISAERSPELDLLRRRFGAEFEAAFRSAFEALTPRERTLLRYQVVDRLGIDRTAAIHGIHRATAARWVAHAREGLVERVRRALQERLQLGTEDELDSLLRLFHSKLELSLRLLLTPTSE